MKGLQGAYSHLARVYETAGWGRFSERMVETVLRLARENGLPDGGRVVDLACGVGIACMRFAQAGYQVAGIDLSGEMLAQAQRKAAETAVEVAWLERDMRDWQLDAPADLVTSMYDALNYMLSADDMGAVFDCVGRALRPEGLFIFDMNTVRALAENWGSKALINFDSEDLFIASQSRWDYETLSNRLVFHGFSRRDDGSWERWRETHVERAFPVDEIRRLLGDAGLETLAMLDAHAEAHTEVQPETTRVLVVARKAATSSQ